MTATMFEPAGAEARWRSVYQLASGQPVGTLITYEQLDEATGSDVRAHRDPIFKASRVLEREDRRTLVVEKNRGYRIAAANEHEGLARKRQRRAWRQAKTGLSILRGTRRDELDSDAVRRLDQYENTLSSHEDMLRRLGRRVQRQEDGLRDVRRQSSETAADHDERLARLETLIQRAGLDAAKADETP
jgi:hypothetical protein